MHFSLTLVFFSDSLAGWLLLLLGGLCVLYVRNAVHGAYTHTQLDALESGEMHRINSLPAEVSFEFKQTPFKSYNKYTFNAGTFSLIGRSCCAIAGWEKKKKKKGNHTYRELCNSFCATL